MEACLENYNCTSFLTWGVHDGISWLGRDCNCLIWDVQQQPKTAVYDAVSGALNNADPDISAQRQAFVDQTVKARERNGAPAPQNEILRFSFNGNHLSYSLPKDQNVHVYVMDARGNMSADLNLGMQTSGTHAIRWTGRQFPAGLYFAKIRSESRTMVIPFTLLEK
jgi:hypothetical protein